MYIGSQSSSCRWWCMRSEAKSIGIESIVRTFSNSPRFCLNYTATPLAFLLHPPLAIDHVAGTRGNSRVHVCPCGGKIVIWATPSATRSPIWRLSGYTSNVSLSWSDSPVAGLKTLANLSTPHQSCLVREQCHRRTYITEPAKLISTRRMVLVAENWRPR